MTDIKHEREETIRFIANYYGMVTSMQNNSARLLESLKKVNTPTVFVHPTFAKEFDTFFSLVSGLMVALTDHITFNISCSIAEFISEEHEMDCIKLYNVVNETWYFHNTGLNFDKIFKEVNKEKHHNRSLFPSLKKVTEYLTCINKLTTFQTNVVKAIFDHETEREVLYDFMQVKIRRAIETA